MASEEGILLENELRCFVRDMRSFWNSYIRKNAEPPCLMRLNSRIVLEKAVVDEV